MYICFKGFLKQSAVFPTDGCRVRQSRLCEVKANILKKLFYEYLPSAFSEVFPAHVLKIAEVIFKKGGGGVRGYFVKSQARYSQSF